MAGSDNKQAALQDVLQELGVDADTAQLVENPSGDICWQGDAQDLSLYGESESYFFEAFVADL